MNHLCLSFLGKPVGFAGAINEDQAVKASIRQEHPLIHRSPIRKLGIMRTIARIANGVGDTVLNEDHEH